MREGTVISAIGCTWTKEALTFNLFPCFHYHRLLMCEDGWQMEWTRNNNRTRIRKQNLANPMWNWISHGYHLNDGPAKIWHKTAHIPPERRWPIETHSAHQGCYCRIALIGERIILSRMKTECCTCPIENSNTRKARRSNSSTKRALFVNEKNCSTSIETLGYGTDGNGGTVHNQVPTRFWTI